MTRSQNGTAVLTGSINEIAADNLTLQTTHPLGDINVFSEKKSLVGIFSLEF